jgi:outer membrane protein OmpA-like peptidoglycan-associated protein
VAERKLQTEEAALNHAAEPADSALVKVTSPVESLATRAGADASAAVGRLGRGEGKASAEASRIRAELAAGRATLPGIRFAPGTDAIDPSSEPSLQALASVIAESPGAFLVQARADLGALPQDALALANARAAAIKAWLGWHWRACGTGVCDWRRCCHSRRGCRDCRADAIVLETC